MNEDRLNELLKQCDSPIERKLLQNLCPHLTTDSAKALRIQHRIDYYPDMDLTVPDFAFPKAKIAIYCDGFKWHGVNRNLFVKDRFQSRELQLRGWIVLRFAGSEIKYKTEMVVEAIQRSIAWRESQSQQNHDHYFSDLTSITNTQGANQRQQKSQPPHASFVAKLHKWGSGKSGFMLNKKQMKSAIVWVVAGVIAGFLVWQMNEIVELNKFVRSHAETEAQSEPTVYITNTGKKYHREDCRFLEYSKKSIPLAEAREKYDPCKVCKPSK